MAKAVVMPKAGNSVEECNLTKWRISVGDTIKEGDIICDAETDKSTIEVESTASGQVLALLGKEGDLIPVLTPIAVVGAAGEDISAFAAGAAPAAAAPAAAPAAPAVAAAPAAPAAPAVAAAPAAPVAVALPATVKEIVMPKAGNSVEECNLSAWRIKVGDEIKVGDVICDAETDKSSIEVEATAAGKVLKLLGNPGDLIPVLQPIVLVGNGDEDVSGYAVGGAAAPAAAAEAAPAAAAPVAAAPAAAVAAPVNNAANGPMSPRAKKFVAEHPFVVPAIAGSGFGGRIMEADVKAAYQTAPHLSSAAAAMLADGVAAPAAGTGVSGMILAGDMGKAAAPAAAAPAAAAPAAPAAKSAAAPAAGEDVITEKPFPQIRKIIAKRLLESMNGMAQYTLNSEADVSGLLALRSKIKENGEKLGLANINIGDMIMFAVIKALKKHPEMNGEYSNNVVKLHSAINMGFACDTARGLMVPVLHNSQNMTLADMCKRVKVLAKSANEGNLNPDLMAGATFTVSNLGSFGITTFTPIASAPQLAILGVGKTLLRPIRTKTGEIVYKDYMQFSLTMNHMVIDGAPGARFLQTLKDIIENFELVCIAAN